MPQPQPVNRRKRFFVELSRTQLLITIAASLFILSWVFILGIIVGRGIVADTITQAMKAQISKLQQEKKALMDKYMPPEQPAAGPQGEILKPQLDFYDQLGKKDQEHTVMTAPRPTAPPAAGSATVLAPPAAEKPAEPVSAKAPAPPPAEKIGKGSPPAASEPAGTFTVQLGSYREEGTAQTVAQRLSDKGYQPKVSSRDIPEKGGKWFRVRIGPFKTRAEAESAVKKLEQDGFQAMVIGKKD